MIKETGCDRTFETCAIRHSQGPDSLFIATTTDQTSKNISFIDRFMSTNEMFLDG